MTNEKIELKDVLNFFEFEKVRAETRARIIELKGRRRVSIGPAPLLRLREPRHPALPDPGDVPGRADHR
jgi:hypothetical protein